MDKGPELHGGSALGIQFFFFLFWSPGSTQKHNASYSGFWVRAVSQPPAYAPQNFSGSLHRVHSLQEGLSFPAPDPPSLASLQGKRRRLPEIFACRTEPPRLGSGASHSLPVPPPFLGAHSTSRAPICSDQSSWLWGALILQSA